jgi:ABC-type multidrug transport system ATPase subunit
MLTAQQIPDTGSIHIDGLHVASEKLKVISKIGLCPQFDDLLIPTMNVADHLRLFCAMNGVGKVVSDEYISLLLNAFGIASFKDVACGNLSGGTKRKVSTAIAVMLPRSLVVLDESSSGLDPLARQKLWNTVALLNQNRTTVMTTHYVNETSFCDRIAIMSAGELKCVDTEHSLAKRFAKGYKATLYFKDLVPDFNAWAAKNLFPEGGVELKVDNVIGKVVVVDFKSFSITLGLLLKRLSAAKSVGELKDFIIGRMTLENVFLDIVNAGKAKSENLLIGRKTIALAPLNTPTSAVLDSVSPAKAPSNPLTTSLSSISPGLVDGGTLSMSPAKRAASLVALGDVNSTNASPSAGVLSMSPAARANSKKQL